MTLFNIDQALLVAFAVPSGGSVSAFAFSPDPEQELLYATDYGNSHICTQ